MQLSFLNPLKSRPTVHEHGWFVGCTPSKNRVRIQFVCRPGHGAGFSRRCALKKGATGLTIKQPRSTGARDGWKHVKTPDNR